MFTGILLVTVSTANEAIAIEDVVIEVYVRKYSPAGDYVMADVVSNISGGDFDFTSTTNVSGQTKEFIIETPNPNLSFIKGGKVAPFSVCDVHVRKEGYIPMLFLGVQVYGGQQSNLNVSFEPQYSENPEDLRITNTITGENTIVYDIPNPAIFTGAQRGPFSYSAPTAIPQISRSVYIPETITVHLGAPQSDAENVYVSFVDYIKNVASSEIYPTWPESAIRANVYAQISITLNRVYTEWYPSQGYDFQITNSTGYDQSFSPGRNVFSSVDRIVDEIFNTYIKRINYIEPLFASYCDGVQTTCRGLSQWGSYELATTGYTPLGILKNYYGDSIELVTTNIIQGIESTYGGTPLSIGSVGDDVLYIQRQLNRIRQNYPTIPRIISENGIFTSGTDAAVRRFQSIFNMSIDGVVGKATWYKISYIYTAVTGLAELESEGANPLFPSSPPTVNLSVGDSGSDVVLLQSMLLYISYFYNSVKPISVDSYFGNETRQSVESFQTSFNLPVTGSVDEAVWDMLFAIYDSILEVVTPTSEEQEFPGDLTLGDTGEKVLLMQQYLTLISQYYPDVLPPSETGVYDEKTANSVRSFQSKFTLGPTGTIGVRTWLRIVEVYNFLQSGLEDISSEG